MPAPIVSAALASAILVSAGAAMAAGPLDAYRWKARVLVVSAPSAGDSAFKTQTGWLDAEGPALRDRDLVVIRLVGDTAMASDGRAVDPSAVRRFAGLPKGTFAVALIGKDGGGKFKTSEPVPTRALFETIDAMPMRQDEIKAQTKR